jgi:putative PIN family toxin of toxin-antitoxin system
MKTERLVVDTNVCISGLLWKESVPARVLDHAIAHGHLIATAATYQELYSRLLLKKFDVYVTRPERELLLESLAGVLTMVEAIRTIRACRDPDDDRFLEAAVNGDASHLITGDKDLLVLHPFAGIAIVTPADFIKSVAMRTE